jgi:hypothetical protein
MPQARKTQSAIESTPYYLCTTRCLPKTLRRGGLSVESFSADGMQVAVNNSVVILNSGDTILNSYSPSAPVFSSSTPCSVTSRLFQ